jgi:excinuclease ABC subunit C
MTNASDNLNFEIAAVLRDRINAIKVIEQKQFFTEDPIEEHAALYKEKVLKTHQWLEKALKLESTPDRIEAFDISNTGSSNIAGSMIVFVKGKPLKKDYRRFKIRTKKGQDDYASMSEVVSRRIKRYFAGDEKFSPLPDIMLIDGGANHASVVNKLLTELDITVPVFGMVKDEKHKTRALVTPDGEEIGLAANPAVFALIGTIQEEAHRFAVEYHRNLRTKTMLGRERQPPPSATAPPSAEGGMD